MGPLAQSYFITLLPPAKIDLKCFYIKCSVALLLIKMGALLLRGKLEGISSYVFNVCLKKKMQNFKSIS